LHLIQRFCIDKRALTQHTATLQLPRAYSIVEGIQ
jgi:hypothetical protein